MLSIYATTELLPTIQSIIEREDRLSELVQIADLLEEAPQSNCETLIVNGQGIHFPLDWENSGPPYLLPAPLELTPEHLLGLIFSKLDNGEKAWSYLEGKEELLQEIGLLSRLRHGYQITLAECRELKAAADKNDSADLHRRLHNVAVLEHYGFLDQETTLNQVLKNYEQALEAAPNGEYQAFTARQYATVLLDTGQLAAATTIVERGLTEALSDQARFSLQATQISIEMQMLGIPYDWDLIERLKVSLWETLQFFEKNNRTAEAAMLYMDAAQIANISESFAESLGYITKAIRLFDDQGLQELAASAQLRKGTLLYTWAQSDNPQFFQPAIQAYQEALKTFRQDVAPDVFADIHHHLAVLYAEMPDENKKRGIWAGVAASSFQEALNYFTKEAFPYQYAMICNNYGNALVKFPPAIHSDNYEKALFYYQEALNIRTAELPHERAITLLNFLEASWNVSNASDEFNAERYHDMLAKAEEVKTLVEEPGMIAAADEHLRLLEELKASFSQ